MVAGFPGVILASKFAGGAAIGEVGVPLIEGETAVGSDDALRDGSGEVAEAFRDGPVEPGAEVCGADVVLVEGDDQGDLVDRGFGGERVPEAVVFGFPGWGEDLPGGAGGSEESAVDVVTAPEAWGVAQPGGGGKVFAHSMADFAPVKGAGEGVLEEGDLDRLKEQEIGIDHEEIVAGCLERGTEFGDATAPDAFMGVVPGDGKVAELEGLDVDARVRGMGEGGSGLIGDDEDFRSLGGVLGGESGGQCGFGDVSGAGAGDDDAVRSARFKACEPGERRAGGGR